MKKHILFDFDDTLVPAASTYRLAMEDVGLSEANQSYIQCRKVIKDRLTPGYPPARSRLLYFKEMLLLEGTYQHKKLYELMDAYEAAVATRMAKAWADLKRNDLMDRLLRKGFTLSIVSNEMLRMQLKKLSLIDPSTKYFNHSTFSEEAGIEKPSPKIFELALARAGAKPEDCWMIGDSPAMDIRGATSLGISTVLTTEFWSSEKLKDPKASEGLPASCRKISDLNQLLDVVS